MPQSFSNKFPAVNRKLHPELAVIEAQIVWKDGSVVLTYNDLALAAHLESLPLGEPCAVSDISGRPAYLYRSRDLEVALSRTELYRFMRHNLEPQEFFALAKKYGVFFEIHDDFYDEETGRAMQPRWGAAGEDSFVQKCLRGDESPEAIDDYVEQWHALPESTQELHEFLGMRTDEYAVWMVHPSRLYQILFERLRDYGEA